MCTYFLLWKYIHRFLSIKKKKTGYKKVYREESNFGKSDVYGNEKGRVWDQDHKNYHWVMWW